MSAEYQFHPWVHERWGSQDLHFMLVNFRVAYDSRDLEDTLERVFDAHDLTAQATYELIGRFDLMLRLWIPHNKLRAFRADLKSALDTLSRRFDVLITVADTVRHWPWGQQGCGRNRRGELVKPTGDLEQPPAPRILHELNRLTSGSVDLRDRPVDQAIIEEWVARNVIRFAPPGRPAGIRVVSLVSATGDLSDQELNGIESHLARTLDETDPSVISECSLYRTDNGGMPFLLMWRAAVEDFCEIRDGLMTRLQAPLIGKARSTTYPIVRQELVPFKDAIAIARPSRANKESIDRLLAQDESNMLEVKGSAFAPVDPWLQSGEPLIESKGIFDNGVLKSVVAFLNGEGGTVVVGALETSRYKGASREVDERLEQFPVVGQYVCIGLVDPFFAKSGWDAYQRRLMDLLDQRITSNPVSTGAVTIERAEFAEREFCLIRVDTPQDGRWYYASPDNRATQFFVRRGASVVELQGPAADDYKERRAAAPKA